MPVIKSAKKRVRQGKKRYLRNKIFSSKIKNSIKDIESAIKKKDKKKSNELFKLVQKLISKAGNENIFHKKTASRKISVLSAKIKAI